MPAALTASAQAPVPTAITAPTPAPAPAPVPLEHDRLNALLWARAVGGVDTKHLSGVPLNAAAIYSRDAVWQAAQTGSGSDGMGLTKALELDLHEASLSSNNSYGANDSHQGVAMRRLTDSDVSFLQQMVAIKRTEGVEEAAASQRGGGGHGHSYREGNGHQTCSYDDFVHFTRWWAPLRGVVAWLGADWRKVGADLMVHGFLTGASANQKLQGCSSPPERP